MRAHIHTPLGGGCPACMEEEELRDGAARIAALRDDLAIAMNSLRRAKNIIADLLSKRAGEEVTSMDTEEKALENIAGDRLKEVTRLLANLEGGR